LRLALEERGIARVLAAGFPTVYPNREYVDQVSIPKYFVQSTCDAFGPKAEMQAFFESLPNPKRIEWIPSADHFFRDNLDGLEQAVVKIGSARQE
jgi:uncharacterized protein